MSVTRRYTVPIEAFWSAWHRVRGRVSADYLLRRAARGAIWNLSGEAFARLATLGATVVTARLLGAGHFGALALVQLSVSTLSTLSGLGVGLIVVKFVSEHFETDRVQAGSFLGTSILICAIAGIVGSSLLLGLAGPVAGELLGRRDLRTPVALAAGVLLAGPLADAFTGGLNGMQRFRERSALVAARGCLDAGGLIVGSAIWGLEGGVTGYLAAEVTSALAGWWLLRREAARCDIVLRWIPQRKILVTLLRFGIPAMAASGLFTTCTWVSTLILAHREGGLPLVALFTVSMRWYLVIQFVPNAAGVVLLPLLGSLWASGRIQQFRRLLKSTLLIDAGLVIPLTAAVVLLAPLLLGLQGRGFPHDEVPFDVLALAAIPSTLNNVLSQAAVSLRQTFWWVASDLALAGVLLGVAIEQVPASGVLGLSVAYLSAYLVTDLVILPALAPLWRSDTGDSAGRTLASRSQP